MYRLFAAGEWITLSVEERVRRCRMLADEARTLAAKESKALREHYLELATRWAVLVDEMRAEIERRPA